MGIKSYKFSNLEYKLVVVKLYIVTTGMSNTKKKKSPTNSEGLKKCFCTIPQAATMSFGTACRKKKIASKRLAKIRPVSQWEKIKLAVVFFTYSK